MPDIDLPVSHAVRTGKVLVYRTSTTVDDPLSTGDDFKFVNAGKTAILVKNGAGEKVITVDLPVMVDGRPVPPLLVTIAPDTDVHIGPFPVSIYNDGEDKVTFSLSAVVDISLALISAE